MITIRIRPEVYEDLRRDAESNGRSIGAQAETRLIHREPNKVGALVGASIDAVQSRAGCAYTDDERVRLQCRAAAEFALNVLLGSPLDVETVRAAIATEQARLNAALEGKGTPTLDAILGLDPPSREKAEQSLAQLQDWLAGLSDADDILSARLKGAAG